MKRRTFLVTDKADLAELDDLLTNGWVPEKAYSTDQSILLLLALSEEEDEIRRPGDLEDVDSILSVDINAADEKLRDGYRVLEAFAKTVTLVKRRKPVPAGVV
jgi:hypothetical protein